MTDFSDMLSKAKAMQEKMKEAQDQIKKIVVEGEAGGNLVKVVLSGDYEIKSITISDAAKKEGEKYFIYLVSNALNEKIKIFEKINNPAKLVDDNSIDISTSVYELKL